MLPTQDAKHCSPNLKAAYMYDMHHKCSHLASSTCTTSQCHAIESKCGIALTSVVRLPVVQFSFEGNVVVSCALFGAEGLHVLPFARLQRNSVMRDAVTTDHETDKFTT